MADQLMKELVTADASRKRQAIEQLSVKESARVTGGAGTITATISVAVNTGPSPTSAARLKAQMNRLHREGWHLRIPVHKDALKDNPQLHDTLRAQYLAAQDTCIQKHVAWIVSEETKRKTLEASLKA